MRFPDNTPKLFHDAVVDFLNALDVSIDRIAPFAGLHPSELRRLGKDGKHHTLQPNAIDRLIDAPDLIGKTLSPELRDAWGRNLKVSSLYTVFILMAHRRTASTWPQQPTDYKFLWDHAFDFHVYSGRALFGKYDGSYKTRTLRGFPGDSVAMWKRWAKNEVESEEDILSTLKELDQTE